MNILILGSGGREHALAWKIKQSSNCDALYVAPGNAGTASVATNVDINAEDFDSVKTFVMDHNIKMVVVGPEAPLVSGVVDYFNEKEELKNVAIIGPGGKGATLEGSKDYSKDFMIRHGIPTARATTFTKSSLQEGLDYLDTIDAPYVLKADGLAAGKGVIISDSRSEAKKELTEMLANSKFGQASDKVVIEEFLEGIELSVFVLTDGKNYKILPEAKDYKRIGEGDTGPNTGGMGAVSPVNFAHPDFLEKVEEKVVKPTIQGLEKDGIPYKGFIFIGLMNMGGEPFVIEYNVRMGDPETQVVLPRIKTDLVELLDSTWKGTLDQIELEIYPDFSTTVVLVSGGYPGSYEKGKIIDGISDDSSDSIVFHAGTKAQEGGIATSGGRVLAITGKGGNLEQALSNSYNRIENISWEGMNFRKDIGQDLLALETGH